MMTEGRLRIPFWFVLLGTACVMVLQLTLRRAARRLVGGLFIAPFTPSPATISLLDRAAGSHRIGPGQEQPL